jgi:outer membrane protein assembly factor BamB/3',5'-cyclic AMP phosphodiesterase CpdA
MKGQAMFRRNCGLLCLWILLLALPCAAQQNAPFQFVHITDTHVTSSRNDEHVRHLVERINRMSPRPAFLVHTGDVTELGRPEEFDRYNAVMAGLSVPHFAVPGNHDVRWSPTGKTAFTRSFGKLYHSFDYQGCRFILLDTTVLLQHWGLFDYTLLRWLESDLKRLRRGTPIFLFFHHPIGRERTQIMNEEALLRLLAPYHVAAIFVGHGHADISWKVNGIPCFMAKGLYQGSYHLVEVGQDQVKVSLISRETGEMPKIVATLPRTRTALRRIAFGWDDPNIALLERRRFLAEIRENGRVITDERVKAEYMLNNEPAKPMAVDKRDKDGLSFVAQFETKGLWTGAHRLRILIKTPDGEVYRRDEFFEVERLRAEPRRAWEAQAGDSIQGSPVMAGDTLFFASLDRKVYAIQADNGKRRWIRETGGPMSASPVLDRDSLYVGSTDGFLYSLDAKTGRVRWKFDTGSPLFASPAVSGGVVCIGGYKKIYGLDAASGRVLWTQEAGSFFQSRAAADKGVFYLGGWDNTLYALEASTGQVKWRSQMGRSDNGRGELIFYFSPAIASPTIAEDRLYICSNDGVLHALNAQTGQEIWTARAPQGGDTLGHSSPLYADGMIIVGGLGEKGQGDCYAFDAESGKLLWRCSTGADNYDSSPARLGDLVALGSVEGRVSWIELKTGKLRYQFALDPGYLFSTPANSEKRSYITSMNGKIYAISLP